jgi:HEAT repeat protein
MPKRAIEEQIVALSRLREAPLTEVTLTALRQGLADRINLVCAKAAQVAGLLDAKPLIPDLVACFLRFLKHHGEADPQCWAKNAIAKALTDLGHDEAATFLPGCRYMQMESVWGGKIDTAVTLRSLCTLALVQCADLPRAAKLRHLVLSMTDSEETVRIDAIRAVEQMEGQEAALLLRLKAAMGDRRAAVTGQALESFLRVEGEHGLDFAGEFLVERPHDNPREMTSTWEEVVEEAALALAASRLPAAVEVLIEAWRKEPRIAYLQAISASRQESGFAFLLELVRTGRERDAAGAVDALALHRDSPQVRERVEDAVNVRGSPELAERFRRRFITG